MADTSLAQPMVRLRLAPDGAQVWLSHIATLILAPEEDWGTNYINERTEILL